MQPLHEQQRKRCQLQPLADKRCTHGQDLCWVLLPSNQPLYPAITSSYSTAPGLANLLGGLACEQCCLATPTYELLCVMSEFRHAVGHGGQFASALICGAQVSMLRLHRSQSVGCRVAPESQHQGYSTCQTSREAHLGSLSGRLCRGQKQCAWSEER